MTNGDKPINPVMDADRSLYRFNDGHEDHVMKEYMVGLTKREYFAALAMQGLLSNKRVIEVISEEYPSTGHEYLAKESIKQADALLLELEKK